MLTASNSVDDSNYRRAVATVGQSISQDNEARSATSCSGFANTGNLKTVTVFIIIGIKFPVCALPYSRNSARRKHHFSFRVRSFVCANVVHTAHLTHNNSLTEENVCRRVIDLAAHTVDKRPDNFFFAFDRTKHMCIHIKFLRDAHRRC